MLVIDNPLSFATVVSVINVVHVSFAMLFLLEFIAMKLLGYRLFGHENKKTQQMIIYRMTFSTFSILFVLIQSWLMKTGNSYGQILIEAFLFSMFLSWGVVCMLLWGVHAFLKEKREKTEESKKETVRLYGICNIAVFESYMTKISNALFALSEIEEELTQEEIIRINERTKEVQSLFTLYRKLSPRAKKEVEEDILFTLKDSNLKLETLLAVKNEKYVRSIKRKTKRMNTKTV